MSDAGRSAAGDAWAEWYDRRGVWWGRPEDVTADRLRSWGRDQWLADIVRAADLRPGDGVRVLEAGCGTGQYGLALALQGFDVDALDCNPAALQRARQLAARTIGADRAPTLLEGDLLCLPTDTDTYDLVFNQQVMEYFVDEAQRRAALAEMARTTKPGGKVVVVVARPEHPFARWWRRTGWPGFIDQPDMLEVGADRLTDELRAAGLVDVRSDGIGTWRSLTFWPRWYDRWAPSRRAVGVMSRWLDHVPLPRALRRRFGLQLLVVGSKPRTPASRGASSRRTGGPW